MSVERIDKIIASQGTLSRTEVKKLIRASLVRVNGQAVKKAEDKFETSDIIIEIDGVLQTYKKNIYIMLNKPNGVVSASRDPKAKTVVDLVPKQMQRKGLFPAGRLDADTTGFVLITDDGDFAHRVLSPKNRVEKTYKATLANPLSSVDIKRIEEGIELADGTRCLGAKISVVETSPKTIAQIKICEGKYHQVKRMFAAVGNNVEELERTAIGNVALDPKLLLGECRELTKDELKSIENAD